MDARKQKLLRQHRRQKRIAMLTVLVALLVIGVTVSVLLVPLLVVLGWIAHEAWFADHLFYRPQEDYRYEFPPDSVQLAGRIEQGCLHLAGDLPDADTLILEVQLKATWAGRLRDPRVYIGGDRQDFERGVRGRRYLNLSGQQEALRAGSLLFDSRYCRLGAEVRLHAMRNPDYTQRRVLIIAPHADDAELAAFGLYSHTGEVAIVTLTQGEIEADNYRRLGLDSTAAARLKGRLRTWGSLAVPLCRCGVAWRSSTACSLATTVCNCRRWRPCPSGSSALVSRVKPIYAL